MLARIYQRPKAATQSGRATVGDWILDWQSPRREHNDALMGWWGSSFTQGQVRMAFPTKEEAVGYAERNGIKYQLEQPPVERPLRPKAYADNFRYGRAENWTH